MRRLGRTILLAFFQDIKVIGQDRFPVEGPVVVVANHFNSLIDGVLVTGFLPRIPRLLAASTVWNYKPLVPVLRAAGVIPVFRREEVGVKGIRNQPMFGHASDLLAAGGVFAIFPEGVSHNQPHLMPVKTGAARIVLEAEQSHGPLGVRIVPVGLVYDAKTAFRSAALIQIGEPMDASTYAQSYHEGDVAGRKRAIKSLTADIGKNLSLVTPSFGSWEEAEVVGRAADIWAHQEPELPAQRSLSDTIEMRRAFGEGYLWMRKHYPERTEAAMKELSEYFDLLTAAGLRDEQVGASYPLKPMFRFAGRSLTALIVGLPLSLLGTALNWLPFQISRLFAAGKDLDKMATWSIFPSILMFPLVWLIEAAICGTVLARWAGPAWGWTAFLLILLAAPIAGRAALSFYDVRHRLYDEARGWLLLKTRRNLARPLLEKRREVLALLTGIVDFYERESP